MTTLLRKRRLLLVVGIGALTAAILLSLLQTESLTVGRKQFALLLVGVAALLATMPGVNGSILTLLDRSRDASPATEAMLRRRPGLYLLYSLWFALVTSAGEVLYRCAGEVLYGSYQKAQLPLLR
jgi:hypothetical protein